jgi:two-component system response regulator ChvI
MLASLTQLQADVIVLDWQLRTGLGIDLLPRINAMGVRLPVVFLTGMPAVAAEHAALDQGAVDFVDKARGTAILAKRLYRIVRSYRASPPPESEPALKNDPIRCGPLSLQPDVARAFWNGADIELTFSEFKIVHLLLARAGEYVTYRAIYDCVRYEGFMAGNGEDGFRTNVRSSIKRIRNKFRQFETDFDGIENYPAFGYRWRGLAAAAD